MRSEYSDDVCRLIILPRSAGRTIEAKIYRGDITYNFSEASKTEVDISEILLSMELSCSVKNSDTT